MVMKMLWNGHGLIISQYCCSFIMVSVVIGWCVMVDWLYLGLCMVTLWTYKGETAKGLYSGVDSSAGSYGRYSGGSGHDGGECTGDDSSCTGGKHTGDDGSLYGGLYGGYSKHDGGSYGVVCHGGGSYDVSYGCYEVLCSGYDTVSYKGCGGAYVQGVYELLVYDKAGCGKGVYGKGVYDTKRCHGKVNDNNDGGHKKTFVTLLHSLDIIFNWISNYSLPNFVQCKDNYVVFL